MRPDTWEPTDAVALRMENDLLANENAVLRARMAEAESKAKKARKALAKANAAPVTPTVDEGLLEELTRARSDLRWFIQRLSASPIGFLLRRWEGFRVLEERWLPK